MSVFWESLRAAAGFTLTVVVAVSMYLYLEEEKEFRKESRDCMAMCQILCEKGIKSMWRKID